MNTASLLAISDTTNAIRAGGAITEASTPKWASVSLDFASPALLSQWISQADCKLLLSNRRLIALGFATQLGDADHEGASLIAIPTDADVSVLLTLVQANPNAIGTLGSQLVEELEPAGQSLLNYLKLAEALPAALVRPRQHVEEPISHGPSLSLATYHQTLAGSLSQVGDTPIPLEGVGACRMHLFRDALGNESHMAIEVGVRADLEQPTLVRVHSSCVTGDIFHSQRCDCGHQLNAALKTMAAEGHGVLVYLSQEGRGIGLNNKLKSYLLQQSGLDTVDGNLALGFGDDERDFTYGKRILQLMGIHSVRLLTNNPTKIDTLSAQGIKVVERLPLIELHNEMAAQYVATKARKSGHML